MKDPKKRSIKSQGTMVITCVSGPLGGGRLAVVTYKAMFCTQAKDQVAYRQGITRFVGQVKSQTCCQLGQDVLCVAQTEWRPQLLQLQLWKARTRLFIQDKTFLWEPFKECLLDSVCYRPLVNYGSDCHCCLQNTYSNRSCLSISHLLELHELVFQQRSRLAMETLCLEAL